jgi:hypothetical protein
MTRQCRVGLTAQPSMSGFSKQGTTLICCCNNNIQLLM